MYMTKRKKFLLSFIISWCVVMGVALIGMCLLSRTELKYFVEKGQELYEGDSLIYENLTDEAKAYFETITKEEQSKEDRIMSEVFKYYTLNYLFKYWLNASAYSCTADVINFCVWSTLIRACVIYFVITVEFKGIKKYFKDNLNVLVILGCSMSMFLSLKIGLSMLSLAGTVSDDIFLFAALGLIVSYVSFLLPNLVINLVKNMKKKNKTEVA